MFAHIVCMCVSVFVQGWEVMHPCIRCVSRVHAQLCDFSDFIVGCVCVCVHVYNGCGEGE